MFSRSKGADKIDPSKKMNSSDAAMSDSEDMFGLDWMVKFAKLAQDELTMKNRIMVWMMVALSISLGFNVVLYNKVPDPKVLSTTTDGKYRPIPTLDEPIYNQKQIMSWAEKCVSTIYDLNYNSWNRQIQNNTECLSDNARAGFAKSLETIGVLSYLTPELQGIASAVPRQAIYRKGWLNDDGYYQWVVDIPYRISIDGRRHGTIDVVMTMLIKRVSLNWRDSGVWVETYQIKPAGGGR